MTNPTEQQSPSRVAIIGGGLAGLAAAVAAVNAGLRVELFEAKRRLGGRAGSFYDVQSGELIDYCQHVSMGCCTALADFCQQTGIANYFRRDKRLTFIGPDSRHYRFVATGWLPAPLHLLPGLMRLGYLRLAERVRIIQTMRRLVSLPAEDGLDAQTVEGWLREQGESEQAIRRFWGVVLVSALGDRLDRASLGAAQKVFADGFMSSRHAYELVVPRVPLGEIYDRRLAAWLASRNVPVHLGTRIRGLEGDDGRMTKLMLADGTCREFDYFVVAVPWHQVRALFSESALKRLPALEPVDQIQASPITGVHLWFDRPILTLPHAVLIDRLSQWVFRQDEAGRHCQVVISASQELKGRDRRAVVQQVGEELAAIWPAARGAQLLHWRMVTQPHAVFSVRPGLDRVRPVQETSIANLFLAGDWTATGWPATMEGAVRSGYLAIESLLDRMR